MSDNDERRVTLSRLVYLEADGPRQRVAIIQSMKGQLGRKAFAPYYQDARNAIRAYHSGHVDALKREMARLRRAIQELPRPAGDAKVRYVLARLQNNLRAISDYSTNFGDVDFQFIDRVYRPANVHGVRISCEPTLGGNYRLKEAVLWKQT